MKKGILPNPGNDSNLEVEFSTWAAVCPNWLDVLWSKLLLLPYVARQITAEKETPHYLWIILHNIYESYPALKILWSEQINQLSCNTEKHFIHKKANNL